MTIGARDLLDKFGSPLEVAEALLLGEGMNHDYAAEAIGSKIILEAAKFRVQHFINLDLVNMKEDGVLSKKTKIKS